MKKILITGGAGFIGSYLSESLTERGDSVTVIDNLSTGKNSLNNSVEFIEGSIFDMPIGRSPDGKPITMRQKYGIK